MARKLQRKLTDVTTGEQLADIQEKLEARHIPSQFHIHTGPEVDFYRVFVYAGHLTQAREALKEGKA